MKGDVVQGKEYPRILIIEAAAGGTALGEEIALPLSEAGFGVARLPGYPETRWEKELFKPGMVILDEAVSGSMELSSQYTAAGIPVILVGEDMSEEIWEKALIKAGAAFYLRRPISHEVLVARVKAILRRCRLNANKKGHHETTSEDF